MQKRTLLAAMALTPFLGACGFRLRGVPNFVFHSIYVQAGRGSPVGTLLRRNLDSRFRWQVNGMRVRHESI